MLSIKNLKGGKSGGAAGVANYCEHRANSQGVGYYSGAAPSSWHGTGAAALGLTGPVDRNDLVRVLEGHLPDGTDLTTRGNRAHNRRLGVDLTISAPKSVSLQALAGGDERILAIHDRAVRKALDLVEREVLTARLGKGGVAHERTGSLVAATWRHEDSRPVNGHVDPQLHTHCILANATRRTDGTWSAMDLQFGEHSVLMHLADAHYKNELARELKQLGYALRRTPDGFELAHITDAQITRFSQRREQIDAALESRGLTRETSDATDRVLANLATREDKTQDDKPDQAWTWRQEAREAGIVLDHPAAGYAVTYPDLSAGAVKSGTRHLCERETVFSRDALRLESLKAGMGDTSLAGVDRAIEAKSGGLLDAGDGKFTTRTALHREQEILARARAGRDQVRPILSDAAATAFIQDCETRQGFTLSVGQRAAVRLALTAPDRVVAIEGAAGAGKTTSMKGIVEAARAQGDEVIGIAPSARARDELESAGAAVNRTVASFLAREHDHNPHRLVILDEAGMVSARDMDLFLQKLETEGGRAVLVGDPRQLKAVEAGAPFAQMLETGAVAHVAIDEIQRQRDPQLREIAQRFALGDARGAVERAAPYMQVAAVAARNPEKPTGPERQAAIARETARAYLDLDASARARTLIVAGTNAVRRQINELVRDGLRDQGEVARDGIAVTALDKAGLTREQSARPESYLPGMVVRLPDGHGRGRHTTDYTVSRMEPDRVVLQGPAGAERLWDPARERAAGVYHPRAMPLAPGDVVLFRENQGRGDARITNGQSARITDITPGNDGRPQITVELDDGRAIRMDPSVKTPLDYGWARTVHGAQGATVDHVIVAGEASRVATAEAAYVSCSRERETLKIITDDPGRLQKSWEKWADKQHALAAARSAESPDLSCLQELRREAAQELGQHGDLARAREQAPAPGPAGHDRGGDLELSR
ncbi:MAG: MobF family relaxase [Acidiferrobacteraceae bacterium]